MGQFQLQQESSEELQQFPHIQEFVFKRNNTIRLNSFSESSSDYLRLFYIQDGKFDWVISGENFTLFPSDLAIILPGQQLNADKGYLDIGALYSLNLKLNHADSRAKNFLGKWSHISAGELIAIRKIIFFNHTPVLSRVHEAGTIFPNLRDELFGQEVGFVTRVNQLLDELFILLTRKLSRQNVSQRDFPQTFLKLEETLRKNLSHHWTVEEMAALVGLGITSFSDRVKNFTGFSPMNYLINIRISEAIRLLKRQDVNVTDIALDTGFYSSQHFSTTFKKLTGYTPSQFRKNNLSKN
jgi:AraC-like DNA-binding protein